MNIEREALVILAERGWARFDSGICHDGPLCMGGALWAANARLGYPLGWDETREHAKAVIGEQWPEFVCDGEPSVIGFNDRRGRTVDEVVAVLTKASIRRDEVVA